MLHESMSSNAREPAVVCAYLEAKFAGIKITFRDAAMLKTTKIVAVAVIQPVVTPILRVPTPPEPNDARPYDTLLVIVHLPKIADQSRLLPVANETDPTMHSYTAVAAEIHVVTSRAYPKQPCSNPFVPRVPTPPVLTVSRVPEAHLALGWQNGQNASQDFLAEKVRTQEGVEEHLHDIWHEEFEPQRIAVVGVAGLLFVSIEQMALEAFDHIPTTQWANVGRKLGIDQQCLFCGEV